MPQKRSGSPKCGRYWRRQEPPTEAESAESVWGLSRRITGPPQRLFQRLPLIRLQLLATLGHIEHVDGLVRLSVDKDHFNVAAVRCNRRRQVVEQPRPVLGHNL